MLTAGSPAAAASLAGNVLAPIFSAGRLEGELESNRARFAELAADYRQAVLIALQETKAALVAADTRLRRAGLLDAAVVQARDAFPRSQLRYAAGADEFTSRSDERGVGKGGVSTWKSRWERTT